MLYGVFGSHDPRNLSENGILARPSVLSAGQVIQLVTIGLLALGTVMVHSAGMSVGVGNGFSMQGLLGGRHVQYAFLASLALFLTSRMNWDWLANGPIWRNPILWLLAFGVGLVALAMFPGMGRAAHGARRWLYLGPSSWGWSFQPSELVKFLMIGGVALWCTHRQHVIGQFWRGVVPVLVGVLIICGLIAVEDLGTGVLIAMVAVLLVLAGGARLWHLALLGPPVLGMLVLAVMFSPYRLARIVAFMNPWDEPEGIGYHAIQSLVAISGGGWTGRGLGYGIQKFGYLPEDTTDFLFAVICEELGFSGAAMVIALYLILLWAGFWVMRGCSTVFLRLVVLGVILTVGLQALMNIAVVTVTVPTKGIALPLVSAGGTGWVVTAAALGLVAGLDRTAWGRTSH